MTRRVLGTFALIAAIAACGGDNGPPKDPVLGEWHLDTFNGLSLPVVDGNATVVSEGLVINADHTWSDGTQTQTGPNAYTWAYAHGTWAATDSVNFVLSPGNGYDFAAKLDTPTSLSVEWLSVSAHYRK
ncbi:MAG TPA: hypothetical protein VGD02_07630 [Gemmatimonadaceae bacterium]|jgi:hypothetical protein